MTYISCCILENGCCKPSDCVCCPGKCCNNCEPCVCRNICCECHYSPEPGCRNCMCEYREKKNCPGYFCLKLTDPLCTCKWAGQCSKCRNRSCCYRIPRAVIHIPKTVEKKNSWIFERDKHAILQQLTCPLCKQMYQNSYILPCEHCLCQCCVDKIKTRDKCSRDNYLIMTCPSCNTAHYFSSKEPIRLPENYLRAKVAQKYGAQYGAPRIAILCEQCLPHKKTEAALRCIVCKINYCQKCHSFSHKSKSFQGHTLTQNFWEGEEKKNCFHHPLTPIIEYCMTDRTLICKQCKCAYHEDHYSLPLTEACTEEAHALFAAIAKFKQVRCRLVNDLMEINLVNTNFKGYKETTKKEICNGFLKLHEILHEQERSVLGSVETIEFRKQQNITQFIDVSDKMLQSIEGIIQYSKEALKEENPVTFLQSANTLVKEIDKEVLQIYQPDSSLKEDPIKNLRLNFDEIASSLCLLFPKPTIGISHLESSQKYPYITDTGENIHVPRFTESRCLVTSRSTESLFPYELRASNFLRGEDTYGRPKSTPPISYKNNSMGEFLEEYPIRSSGNVNTGYTSHNFIAPSSSQQSMVPREPPSPVSIYKTIIYPNAAEVCWTSPPEQVDFYDAEFQEVYPTESPDTMLLGDLIGKMYGIKQQSVTLTNLAPNSEFFFRVRGVNLAGEGEWSKLSKISTPPSESNVSSYSDRVIQRVKSTFGTTSEK